MWRRVSTSLKHRWMDASDTRRAIPEDMLERVERQVRASEAQHGGEIRIFVEASLPASYLWRHLRHATPMEDLVRQRALMIFGKLRVWDTQHNNGVLIYLLLVERRIELLADRGVTQALNPSDWNGMVQHMGQAFAAGKFEAGLTQAVAEVSACLIRHFPEQPGTPNANELPDRPELG